MADNGAVAETGPRAAAIPNFHAVIPAGGSGTRLWPLSRAAHPKFLQPLTGTDRSLLQSTMDRLLPLTEADRLMVVTGAGHAAAVARQLPELQVDQIVAEPSARDSCAAIGLAAAIIEQRTPGSVMGSFAADHVILDVDSFAESVRVAVVGAQAGYLMTIGITPTHPETGFGYINSGEPLDISGLDTGGAGIRTVLRFQEKPPLETAKAYVESGHYLWNASMFVWRTDVFLGELERQRPDIHAKLVTIAQAWDTGDRDAVLDREWPAMPKIAVEYAVMEGSAAAGKVATTPGNFGWRDIGDFDALGELLDHDAPGSVAVLGGVENGTSPVLSYESERLVIVPGGGRLVATLGLSDVIVVDTPDVVLVCPRSQAQGVKKLVEELRNRGQTEYI
jgi:mannose-1-phosphate guanylyltransferase